MGKAERIVIGIFFIIAGVAMYLGQSDINTRFMDIRHPPSAFMTYVVPILLVGFGATVIASIHKQRRFTEKGYREALEVLRKNPLQ